jgi:cell wall-associated NlpC family hydrolase
MTRHSLPRGARRAQRTAALVGLLLAAAAPALEAQPAEAAAAGFASFAASPAVVITPVAPSRVPEARARRGTIAAVGASAQLLRDSVVALARAQIGYRYVSGGESPARGFDCSGLVKYVMAGLALDLPRTANQQALVGFDVPRDTSRLQPGDLLTFGKGRRVTHIGIYVGEGRMVHASSKAGRVIETNLLRAAHPLIKPWRGARSLVAQSDSAVVRGG